MKAWKLFVLGLFLSGSASAALLTFGDLDIDAANGLSQYSNAVAAVGFDGLYTNFVTTATSTGNGDFLDELAGATLTNLAENLTMTLVSVTDTNGSTQVELGNFSVRGLGPAGGADNNDFDPGEKLAWSWDQDVYLHELGFRRGGAGDLYTVSWSTNTFNFNGDNIADLAGTLVTAGTAVTIEMTAGSGLELTGLLVETIPEPATIGMVGFAGLALMLIRRIRR